MKKKYKSTYFIFFTFESIFEKNSSGGFSLSIKDTVNNLKNKAEKIYLINNHTNNEEYKFIEYINFLNFIKFLFSNLFCGSNKDIKFILFGCGLSSHYIFSIIALVFRLKLYWQPSYHSPKYVGNNMKSSIAKRLIRFISYLPFRKLRIIVQTHYESSELKVKKDVEFYGLTIQFKNTYLKSQLINRDENSFNKRKITLSYIGRLNKQKGWDIFSEFIIKNNIKEKIVIVTNSKFNKEAYRLKKIINNIEIFNSIRNHHLLNILKNTKILFLPSNFESLGITHIDAVLMGCFVPMIGRYPFWDDLSIDKNEEIKLLNFIIQNNSCNNKINQNNYNKLRKIYLENLPDQFEKTLKEIIQS